MSSSSSFHEFVNHDQTVLMDVKLDEIQRTQELTQSQWKQMKERFDSMKEVFLAEVNDFDLRQNQLQWQSKHLKNKLREMEQEFQQKQLELDAQERRLEAIKNSWKLRLSIDGIKEQTFTSKLDKAGVNFRQLEMKEMRLNERESELKRREKLLEEKYENSRKKQKRLDSTTSDEDFIHLVICHADDLPSVRDKVKMALKRASNPAKLVLDAIDTFNGDGLEGNCDFEAAGRSFSMVLVEVLWEVDPEIRASERERAMKMALEWKEKIQREDKSEVLGFLQLLLTYRLTDACDKDELWRFMEVVEDKVSDPMIEDIFNHFGLI